MKEKLEEYVVGKEVNARARRWMDHVNTQAADKLTRRLGWFTRAHPLILEDGRMLVGLFGRVFVFAGRDYG